MRNYWGPMLGVVAAASLLSACSGAGAEPAARATVTATATVTTTATVTATPKPDKPTKKTHSPRGLAMGKTWTGSATKTTVLDFKADSAGYGADPGKQWDAALVKTCVLATPVTKDGITLSWMPWSLVDGSGGLYPSTSITYGNFPTPQYPVMGDSAFKAGDCAKGWIVFGVPEHADISGVRYGNESGETVTWQVR